MARADKHGFNKILAAVKTVYSDACWDDEIKIGYTIKVGDRFNILVSVYPPGRKFKYNAVVYKPRSRDSYDFNVDGIDDFVASVQVKEILGA